MALVKYSPLIAEARGKVGDVVFSRNAYAAYVRDHVIPANPNTASQQNVRADMTAASQKWQTLTDVQRKQWESQACEFTRRNIFGDEVCLNGYNWFIRASLNRLAAGFFILTVPIYPPAPIQYHLDSLVADTTAGTMTIAWSPANHINHRIIVYATPGMSTGINFVKSEYRQIASILFAQTSPRNIAADYIAVFGALPVAGTKVFVKIRGVNTSSGVGVVESPLSAVAI